MPPLHDWLSRLRPGLDPRSLFSGWPSAPDVRPAVLPLAASLQALDPPTRDETEDEYDPVIVIGLGRFGEIVVRQWIEQVIGDSLGPQRHVRTLLVTERPVPPLPQDEALGRNVWQQPLSQGGFGDDPAVTRRQACRGAFRAVANFGPVRDFLQGALRDLRRDTRVILVASLTEPLIGVIGDILHLLRLFNRAFPVRSINAFLTFDGPRDQEMLAPNETYAALREIGRFTFNGIHDLEALPTLHDIDPVVRGALLDHVFLVDLPERGQAHVGERVGPMPRPLSETTGQAIAEVLFALTHPSGRELWQHLNNDLPLSAAWRNQVHEAVVNAVGVATLFLPLATLEEYLAVRLAQAALFGERRDDGADGLLAPSTATPPERGEQLWRHWLAQGPAAHPLLNWIFDPVAPGSRVAAPDLSGELVGFAQAFATQCAHGLTRLLNERGAVDRLTEGQAALTALSQALDQARTRFTDLLDGRDPFRTSLLDLIGRWSETAAQYSVELAAWQAALRNAIEAVPAMGVTPAISTGASAILQWQARQIGKAGHPATGSSPAVRPTARTVLEHWRQRAEAQLREGGRGGFRLSMTWDEAHPLREAEQYYHDTVRPDLTQIAPGRSTALAHVRNRLGWWATAQPGQAAQIHLVCLPSRIASNEAGLIPPASACFRPGAVAELCQAVLGLARIQMGRLGRDLSGPWFERQAEQNQDFLKRAGYILLSYDIDAASRRALTSARHAYVVARDKSLAGRFKRQAFDLYETDITELADGPPTRLTALSLRMSIPLETVAAVRAAYPSYQHREPLHLYPQECHAALCEQRIRAVTGQWVSLTPELVLTLVDLRLVSLFCQLVLHRGVIVQIDATRQSRSWSLPAAAGWAELVLAPINLGDETSALWQAYQAFTLELPNDPQIRQNPTNPFHSSQREAFLRSLLTRAREARRRPEGRAQREQFRRTLLAAFHELGAQDALQRGFAALWEVELDKPLWRDW